MPGNLAFLTSFFSSRSSRIFCNIFCSYSTATAASVHEMAKRGETWSDEETLKLICRWGEAKIQKKLDNCHKTTAVYKEISAYLAKDGFNRDFGQCRTKIKHLKSEYKKYKDSLRRSGARRSKEPMFFRNLSG